MQVLRLPSFAAAACGRSAMTIFNKRAGPAASICCIGVGNRAGALEPGGVDHVAQHAGSGSQAGGGEIARFCRACPFEAAGLLQRVDSFHIGCGVAQVSNVRIEHVALNGVRWGDFGLYFWGVEIGIDKCALKLPVDVMPGGVTVGIGANPAVVLDGGVEGLGGIADVVAEPACIEKDSLLDGRAVLMGGGEIAILAQGGLEALPNLSGLPGLEPDLVWALAGGKGTGLEIEATTGQRTESVGGLKVNEVLRGLGGAQLGLRGRPPAVRFGAQVLDLIDGSGRTEKGGDIGGQVDDGEAVDETVALVSPGAGKLRGDGERKQRQGCRCGKTRRPQGRHEASIRLAWSRVGELSAELAARFAKAYGRRSRSEREGRECGQGMIPGSSKRFFSKIHLERV